MSAPAPERPAVAEVPEPAGDAGDRGALEIHRTVLRKIAEHAADLVPGTALASRRIAGVGLAPHGASARLSGPEQELRVRLDLALRYPAPVRGTVRAVRERVREELGRLAGCRVSSVEITVSALVPAPERNRVE